MEQGGAAHGCDAELVGRDAQGPSRMHDDAVRSPEAQGGSKDLRALVVGCWPGPSRPVNVQCLDKLVRPPEGGVDGHLPAADRELSEPIVVAVGVDLAVQLTGAVVEHTCICLLRLRCEIDSENPHEWV